ncbi:MAG: Tol-Pal system protein TolB [Campylobacterota bacterium]|nr:Tol-Pal system protein TolB [Campylobacterota bacterium]
MFKHILLYFIFLEFVFGLDATMEITKKRAILPNISVVVSSDTKLNSDLANKIDALIEKDLQVSGHFSKSNISIESNFDDTPNYSLLQQNAIELYLLLKIKKSATKGIVANIKLYDVNSQKVILNKVYNISNANRYPFLSHKISIDVNSHMKAPSIKWMDRFIIFSRYLNAKESEIVISDYTLTYQAVVVRGNLNIFPKWVNDKQESFYYTTYKYGKPTLIKQNLYTKKTERILSSDGMLVCSDVSKDGKKIILTMAPEGQPDIYTYNIKDKVKTRITKYSGIDVGGSFVENDKKVIFISDRLRYPNIFSKTIGQKGVERMLYHGKNNSQCTTYKDYIVYSSRESDNEFGGNTFNLYLIATHSDYVRRLTTNGRNQFPKFSEDGKSILYIKTMGNKSQLGIIRVNYNKSFLFTLKTGKLQSIDW